MSDPRSETWRGILGSKASWVLFGGGTCVTVEGHEPDPAEAARRLLAAFAQQHGTRLDEALTVFALNSAPGWLVRSSDPRVQNYVAHSEVSALAPDEEVASFARARRDADLQSREVVHVESARGPAGQA